MISACSQDVYFVVSLPTEKQKEKQAIAEHMFVVSAAACARKCYARDCQVARYIPASKTCLLSFNKENDCSTLKNPVFVKEYFKLAMAVFSCIRCGPPGSSKDGTDTILDKKETTVVKGELAKWCVEISD